MSLLPPAMSVIPDFDAFKTLALGVNCVPVYRRMISDALTPVSAFHKLDDGKNACLFESVIGGEKVGRYSFLGVRPFLQIEAYGRRVVLTPLERSGDARPDRWPQAAQEFEADNPLAVLRELIQAVRIAPVEGLPPFAGGAVGYAGYDTVRYVERLPRPPEDDRRLADLSFALYDHMVVFDNVQKTLTVIALAWVGENAECGVRSAECRNHRRAYEAACGQIDAIVEMLSRSQSALVPADIELRGEPLAKACQSNFTRDAFEGAVRKCVEYIRAGDIFQVVISQRLALPLASDPFEVYRTLRVVNPSPFMFFLRTPGTTLVGSSPEIMVRVVGGEVTVRPLAGTRKRGSTPAEDKALEAELLADPKERAEHVMLVDLGRNDVGRVAMYGSVRLSDVMVIERYSHVMHITSNVTGCLRDDCDAFDALAACLPAGTVSGAPKVRAMEIIDELEPHRRGPYAGAVGYIDFGGNMDTCIALRTIVVVDGTAYVQAGAGIVADSVPAVEYQETLNKAGGLLQAIEITERRAAGGSGGAG
jgi:anthranilate synthase component 1